MFRATWGGALLVLCLVLANGRAQDATPTVQAKPFLGVAIIPVDNSGGIAVREVTPESPAAKAGLKTGDRVIKIGDQEVKGVEQFLETVAAKKPGDQLTLQIRRAGKEQDLTVTLGARPATPALLPKGPDLLGQFGARRPAFLGVQTQPLTPELKKRLETTVDAGAVVIDIVPNSPADKAGLKSDDIITAIDSRSIEHPMHLREAVQQAGPGKVVELKIVRGKEPLVLKTTLGEGAFGQFLTPGNERFPTVDMESMFDSARRVRELERRVAELEKQLRELLKK
jgi:S1-C subfamily serine protease